MNSPLSTITFERLIDILPHGSGIDCDWTFYRQKNGSILCRNSYHLMDKHGSYCGWQDFTVKLFVHATRVVQKLCGPLEGKAQILYDVGDVDFILQFNGFRKYQATSSVLRTSLEEEFECFLRGAGIITPIGNRIIEV